MENDVKQKRLEEIYSKYPRKLGKAGGMRILRSQKLNEEKLRNLDMAITNYITHILRENIEITFVKHFSTWVREWKDWIDPEHGKSNPMIKEELKGIFNE